MEAEERKKISLYAADMSKGVSTHCRNCGMLLNHGIGVNFCGFDCAVGEVYQLIK